MFNKIILNLCKIRTLCLKFNVLTLLCTVMKNDKLQLHFARLSYD